MLSLNNSKWGIEYLEEALEDLKKLDGSVRKIALKAIDKVSQNPLPQNEGGYGKPLGNKQGSNLTGLLKIKLKNSGIRIIYSIKREKQKMKIIIIGVRGDNEVYDAAGKRINDNCQNK